MKKKSRMRMETRQKMSQRKIIMGTCLAALVGVGIFFAGNFSNPGTSSAAIGMHGAKTVSTSNVKLNEYTNLTANAASGATSLTVTNSRLNSNSRFSGNMVAGELILIIQMQGATITTSDNANYGMVSNYNNAGKYEFAEVATRPNNTTITLTCGLKNSYTSSGKVQIIRVPRYTSLTVNSGASIIADAWNGTQGGIVAMEVSGTSTINGTIDVSGLGFRGGVVENHSDFPGLHTGFRSTDDKKGAEKGESIAGYQTDYDGVGRYGRGAPANGGGGGNAHNASGGGGANAGDTSAWNGLGNPDTTIANWKTAWKLESANFHLTVSSGGGRGGYTYSANASNVLTKGPTNAAWGGDNRYSVGGYGGRPLDYTTGRIFFGGGGGAGDSNDGTGTSGADGGGIVFLLVGGNTSGSGTIKANGDNAGTTTGPQGWDGSGGGGGGGAIIMYAKNATISSLSLEATGGTGGNQIVIGDPEAEGAGGGGGGGYVALTNKTGVSITVAPGVAGASNSTSVTNFTPNGATKGATGTSNGTAPTNPYSGVSTLPVELVSFSANPNNKTVELKWATASENQNDYFGIERSEDGNEFVEISRIDGNGTTRQWHDYQFTDMHPFAGTSYYRLRQTDSNGDNEIFKIVSVSMNEKKEGFSIAGISPNPFRENFDLSFSTDNQHSVIIDIYSINGQKIAHEQFEPEKGNNVFRFSAVENMKAGIYIVSVNREGESPVSMKVVKQ